MKIKFFLKPAFCLIFFAGTLIACQKETQPLTADAGRTFSSVRPQVIAKTNQLVLKTFSRDDRTYHFAYAPNGILDSIMVTGDHSYVYRVWYKGAHIDSVILVDNGRLISTNTNFEYKGNLITGYDYWNRVDNAPYSVRYTFAYDNQKRMVSFEYGYQGKVLYHTDLAYDVGNNVITWNDFTVNSANYSYDEELNPLHLVPDLFAVMVEEPWIWEYSFSLHNSVTKTYFGGNGLSYQNQYNSFGQLVTKSLSDNSGSFSFTYQ